MFLKEYKYVVKEKRTSKFITDDIETSFDDSHKEDSDKKNSDEENSDKDISDEKIKYIIFF